MADVLPHCQPFSPAVAVTAAAPARRNIERARCPRRNFARRCPAAVTNGLASCCVQRPWESDSMRIVVPKEMTPGETRVALIPESVGRLVKAGQDLQVESGAGE